MIENTCGNCTWFGGGERYGRCLCDVPVPLSYEVEGRTLVCDTWKDCPCWAAKAIDGESD